MDTIDRFKIFAALIIWALGFLGGMLPITAHNINPISRSVLNMFAAGIFLAGSICHLLPDAVENQKLSTIACVLTLQPKTARPTDNSDISSCSTSDLWAYIFFGIGFLLILLLEIFAHEVQKNISESNVPHEQTPLILNTSDSRHRKKQSLECSGSTVAHAHVDGMIGEFRILSMVVYVALSFHSLMEGVAIGSQHKSAWNIFLAVIAHKSLTAFALGLELISHRVGKQRLFLGIFIFSCMTPFGIFLGRLTLNENNEESIMSGICTAMSGGTFLFVATMEIIPQELQNRKNQCSKSLALCIGFVSFGALAQWV